MIKHILGVITIENFECEPSHYVWMNKGTLVIDSIFQRSFLGNLNLLMSCLEDHADDESIEYYDAIEEYKAEYRRQ